MEKDDLNIFNPQTKLSIVDFSTLKRVEAQYQNNITCFKIH